MKQLQQLLNNFLKTNLILGMKVYSAVHLFYVHHVISFKNYNVLSTDMRVRLV